MLASNQYSLRKELRMPRILVEKLMPKEDDL